LKAGGESGTSANGRQGSHRIVAAGSRGAALREKGERRHSEDVTAKKEPKPTWVDPEKKTSSDRPGEKKRRKKQKRRVRKREDDLPLGRVRYDVGSKKVDKRHA